MENSKETLLLIKTSGSLLPKLALILKKHHTYEVPELIALPIEWGDRPYLDWLEQNLQKPRRPISKTGSKGKSIDK